MEQEINVTAAFIRWFSVNFQARHLRFLRYKIFRFRQAQQFIALVGLSFCYFTRTGGALRPCTILQESLVAHPSAILNVFGLIMIEITSRGCFNHAY